jgi:hypothetical protein
MVFLPRIGNPFPAHIDEWHHINEALALKNGNYIGGVFAYEIGFHAFLAGLSSLGDIVIIYQFLPAIWAALTSIVLFFLVYKITNKNFSVSLISIIFFGMLHSSKNLLGISFFTPLSFSIPFIFLYVYFLIWGLQQEKKSYIIISVIIMIFLIPIYSLSVLAMVPLIIILLGMYFKFVKKEYKFFLILLTIPLVGFLFYSIINDLSFSSVSNLVKELNFKKGWIEYTKDNSALEVYSLIGYFFAVIGFLRVIIKKERGFYPFLIWPICMLIWILIFKLLGINFLSPYQRNFYFFAVSLPFISSLGVHSFFSKIKKLCSSRKYKKKTLIIILLLFSLLILFFAMKDVEYTLYSAEKFITPGDYNDLSYLSLFPKGVVLANLNISEGVISISKQEPAATKNFYKKENRVDIISFFESSLCEDKNIIVQKLNVKYIISPIEIPCNYTLISNTNNFIYKIEEIT